MPHGVNDHFLRILQNERSGSRRALILAITLLPAAYFMAELADEAFLGIVVWTTLLAILAGAGLGVLWARHQTTHYSESLRLSWNAWMRMSLSCSRVDEVARHVQERPARGSFRGALVAGVILLNGALFAVLWADLSFGMTLGILVTALDGLVLGGLAAQAVWQWRWTTQFAKALDELVAEGKVGLWGEV